MSAIDTTMEPEMTAHDPLMTPAPITSARHLRTGIVLAVAILAAVVTAMGLTADFPARADKGVEMPPTAAAKAPTATAPLLIDHAAIDWDKLPVEPDPSALSVAAYGAP